MVQFGTKWASRLAGGFSHAEVLSHGHIDAENGEWFLHKPMVRKPNYPQMEDPDRQVVRLRATFMWEYHSQRLGMSEIQVATRKPKIIVNRCNLKQPIKAQDILVRECDGTMFEAHAPEKDGLSGIEICLTQLGTPH